MGYKNYILYCGNEAKSFESYFNGEKVSVKSDTYVEEDWDQIAIEKITAIQNITVSAYQDRDLQLNFTPITDEEFLQAVSSNKTKVRIQILLNEAGVSSDLVKDVDGTLTHLKTGHLNRARRNRKCVEARFNNFQQGQKCYMRKPWSHDPDLYGVTWKNLTSEELRNGLVKLNNIGSIPKSRSYNRGPDIPIIINAGSGEYTEGCSPDIIISAELYIPCLDKSNTDTFMYERSGGRKVASNCIFQNDAMFGYGFDMFSDTSNVFRVIEI